MLTILNILVRFLAMTWKDMQILRFYIARLIPGFMLFQNLKISNLLAARSNIFYSLTVPILFYNI